MKKTLSLILIFSTITGIVFLAGCSKQTTVEKWDTVSITYVAKNGDGETIQSKETGDMVRFVVGSHEVITGLDEGVIGMKLNDTATIDIAPENGYGKDYDKMKIQKISRTLFDKANIKIVEGKMWTLGEMKGMIKWIEKDKNGNEFVIFDINPEQTRQTLNYEVTIQTLEKWTTTK